MLIFHHLHLISKDPGKWLLHILAMINNKRPTFEREQVPLISVSSVTSVGIESTQLLFDVERQYYAKSNHLGPRESEVISQLSWLPGLPFFKLNTIARKGTFNFNICLKL